MEAVSAIATLSLRLSGSRDADAGVYDALAAAVINVTISESETMAHGTGSDKVNTFYAVTVGVTGGSFKTIDLQGGGNEIDAFGNPLDIDKLKFLYIKNDSDANLTIGAIATGISIFETIAEDALVLPAGAAVMFILPGDGIAVEAADKDLKLACDGDGTKNIDIAIAGVTA